MAVKIRLKRMGKIRVPQYRIVVIDSRKKRDGKVIEEIGSYRPKEEPSHMDVTTDRALYWLGVGAQPSPAVEAILKVTGDWQKFKGIPGTEGTLKVKDPKRDKLETFNEALKEAQSETKGDAVTSKKKADKAEDKTEEAAPKAATTEKKSEKKADKAEEKTEEAAPKAAAEETPAEVPASETPEVAAEEAEAAETTEA